MEHGPSGGAQRGVDAPLRGKELVEEVRASGWRCFGTSDREKTPGQTKDWMERLYLSCGPGAPGVPRGGAGGGG